MLVPRLLVAVVLAAALVLPLRWAMAATTPVATVETLHQALIAVMKDAAQLSIEQRYAQLAPTLSATYDFETMTRLAVGTAWTDASPDQRTALTSAFSRLSIATYAKRFSGYSGENFETLGEKQGPRGTTLVETRLVRPADPPVSCRGRITRPIWFAVSSGTYFPPKAPAIFPAISRASPATAISISAVSFPIRASRTKPPTR